MLETYGVTGRITEVTRAAVTEVTRKIGRWLLGLRKPRPRPPLRRPLPSELSGRTAGHGADLLCPRLLRPTLLWPGTEGSPSRL